MKGEERERKKIYITRLKRKGMGQRKLIVFIGKKIHIINIFGCP